VTYESCFDQTYWICLLSYILMYSDNHMEHLMVVFEALCDAKLYRKLKKCYFYQESVGFLGYIISSSGVKVDKTNDKSN